MNPNNDLPESRVCPNCGHHYQPGLSGEMQAGCPKCLVSFLKEEVPEEEKAEDNSQIMKVGDRLDGMEILALLGRGGMGVVYKARQDHLDRIVALKVLDARLAQDEEFTSRFGREARALASLNHPNIVHVYDFGQEDRRFYLVMEYVDGTTMRHILKTGRIKPENALRYVAQICDALEYAHDRGVIHRDIKPENILIGQTGNLKIADFGLAKMAARPGVEATLMTAVDRVMGTPNYMAPEQMIPSGAVDHRADIYSLGVVLYEMLTGELPLGRFPMPSQSVQVDVHFDDVVIKALEQDPNRRYQHASQIKQEVSGDPSTTAAARQPARRPTNQPGLIDFRRLAWLAFVCLPWGLPVLWQIVPSVFAAMAPSTEFHQSEIYRFLLMPFGILTAVLGTVLGWISLQRSPGGERGRWLAWTSALAYPLIVSYLLLGPLWRIWSLDPIAINLIWILSSAIVLVVLWSVRRNQKALLAGGIITTTSLLFGGERLIAYSAEIREASGHFLALFHALGSLTSDEELAQSREKDIHERLGRLVLNRFGTEHLERLDALIETFHFITPDGNPEWSARKDTLLVWTDPDRQGISFLKSRREESGDSSTSYGGVAESPSIKVLDLTIDGNVLVVEYQFPCSFDPETSPQPQSSSQREQRKRFEEIRNFWKKEPNRSYEVRIPFEEALEGGDQLRWWKMGELKE